MQAAHVEVEELAVPGDAGDLEAGQGGDRRVVGLQHADRADVDPGDDPADRALAEEPGERLDLGQLRHWTSLHPAARGRSPR